MKMINEGRIELSVNAALTIPADLWLPGHRGAKIKKLADALAQCGEIGWLRVESLNPAGQASQLSTLNPEPACGHPQSRCPICGWIHDAAFTQINTGQTGNITTGKCQSSLLTLKLQLPTKSHVGRFIQANLSAVKMQGWIRRKDCAHHSDFLGNL